jgi:alpha-L-fucosidase
MSATATSGAAANAIDGINDYGSYTVWESSGALPQSVTLDLGSTKPDVGLLNYVPRYVANMGPSTSGAITDYAISTSTDGSTFTPATTGTWPVDGKMKVATFGPVAARYVRLEATQVNGSNAAKTEITVGARR